MASKSNMSLGCPTSSPEADAILFLNFIHTMRQSALYDMPKELDHSIKHTHHHPKQTQHECANCGTTVSSTWRRGPNRELLCNPCGLHYRIHKTMKTKKGGCVAIRRRNRKGSDSEGSVGSL